MGQHQLKTKIMIILTTKYGDLWTQFLFQQLNYLACQFGGLLCPVDLSSPDHRSVMRRAWRQFIFQRFSVLQLCFCWLPGLMVIPIFMILNNVHYRYMWLQAWWLSWVWVSCSVFSSERQCLVSPFVCWDGNYLPTLASPFPHVCLRHCYPTF